MDKTAYAYKLASTGCYYFLSRPRRFGKTTLTLMMGVIFQLPVIAFALTRMGIISAPMLSQYRKHSFIAIMLVAAIITPPDVMTLLLVTLPLCVLYEVSIRVARWSERSRVL